MPQISIFYGIVIRIYWDDHGPPHFHAIYAEHKARIEIASGSIISGKLPRRATRLVEEWTSLHREELMDDWVRAQAQIPLVPIAPLP